MKKEKGSIKNKRGEKEKRRKRISLLLFAIPSRNKISNRYMIFSKNGPNMKKFTSIILKTKKD
tara:strand:- start:92 stop:280 length:189 start_codon:yes stop_codon:yes gene_type:complete